MPRLRLGVVLPVPEPAAGEVDGLRRALGDGALGRIPAHLTLVPPVNVAVESLDEAEAVLLAAAAGAGPIVCDLGPPTTFWPVNPVIYLGVDETALAPILGLRQAVFRPPLRRRLTLPFVPHVTLADEVDAERIGPAVRAMADYRRSVVFDRVSLLEEGEGRRWTPRFEAVLGASSVVGRGGLPLDLSVAPYGDPSVRERIGLAPGLVVTARRQGIPVGLATVRIDPLPAGPLPSGRAARLVELHVDAAERGTGVGSQVLAAALSRAASELDAELVVCEDLGAEVEAFLIHRGFGVREGSGRRRLIRRL